MPSYKNTMWLYIFFSLFFYNNFIISLNSSSSKYSWNLVYIYNNHHILFLFWYPSHHIFSVRFTYKEDSYFILSPNVYPFHLRNVSFYLFSCFFYWSKVNYFFQYQTLILLQQAISIFIAHPNLPPHPLKLILSHVFI